MTTNNNGRTGPAARLQPDDVLGGRWTIQKRMTRSTYGSGGMFSRLLQKWRDFVVTQALAFRMARA